MVGCTVESVIVPQAERKNLLLHLFKGKLMIIPHAEVFLGLFILICRDMNRRIIMVRQASGNKRSVTLICFYSLLALLLKHSSRCKNDTFHVMICQLMI